MAATITKLPDSEDRWGKRAIIAASVVLDNPYPAGGYYIGPEEMGFKLAMGAVVIAVNTAGSAYSYIWNTSTNKLMVFETGAGLSGVFAQPIGVDLSSVNVHLVFLGL